MLEKILARKRQEIEAAKARVSFEELRARVAAYQAQRDFQQALSHDPGTLAVIAELKRKSPSKGMLRERFDPVSLAQTLEEAGAAALSVVTDEPFFGGQLAFLRDVKQFTEIPALRKDFLVEAYQIYEAAGSQADAVLLIVRILPDQRLRELLELARRLGMAALVEVHADEDVTRAHRAGAQLIGINQRDLDTFALDPTLTERLMAKMPSGKVVVAESGLEGPADVTRMRALGVHAVLVGEALMVADQPGAKLRELVAAASAGRPASR